MLKTNRERGRPARTLKLTEYFDKLSIQPVEVWLISEGAKYSEKGFDRLSHLKLTELVEVCFNLRNFQPT